MVKEKTILKADCNLIVCTLNSSDCIPICNGKEMEVLTPKVDDAGKEKHKPVITKTNGGIIVSCGEISHVNGRKPSYHIDRSA